MTDNWNNDADQLARDAKKAAENTQNAAEDAWNQGKEATSDAVKAADETISEVPDNSQNVVEEAKNQVDGTWNTMSDNVAKKSDAVKEGVSDTWNQAANVVEDTTAQAKQDLGQTAEAAKESADTTWESAKDSTQQEWQKVTDEVSKPDPNDPSTWKQDVYAASDTVKTEAGEVIPSWESYKQANPEPVAPLMPEYTTPKEPMQPVIIPPTTTAFGSQTQIPPVEIAKSFTTQTPAYQPLPVAAKTKKGLPAWAIVLLVIGALILLCVLLGVIFFGGIVRSILQGSVPLQMVLSQFMA